MKNLIYPAVFALTLVLIGCGNNNNSHEQTSSPEVGDGMQDGQSDNANSIKEPGSKSEVYVSPLPEDAPSHSVVMFEYSPYKFQDEYGNHVGYDVDILRAISEEQGFKVDITQVPYEQLFTSVQDGSYELAMSGLLLLPSRQAVMSSSDPYSKGKPGYLVQSDKNYVTAEQVEQVSIAGLKDSPLHKMLNDRAVKNIVPEDTMFLSFQAIFTGKADAAIGMEPVLMYESDLFSEHPVRFIPIADANYTTVYSQKDNQALIDEVNEGLKKIKANGRYQKINEKWFGTHAQNIMIN